MTQEQFAETLDISVDFLSLIERGRNAPSFETLDKIARRLKVSVADLFVFERRQSATAMSGRNHSPN
jgi:transcriptional regulator with XRE-family HTH domain